MLRAMPRPPRPTHAGIYHVGVNAPADLPLFRGIENYVEFLSILGATMRDEDATCLAFCLMTTHYHLLLEVGDGALPRTMKRMNWHYARSVNARIGGRGHVVGGRYFSNQVSDTEYLLTAFRYIARNPVEAGLCSAPEHWQWSSYAGTVGLRPPFSFVDATLVVESARGTDWLRTFVDGV